MSDIAIEPYYESSSGRKLGRHFLISAVRIGVLSVLFGLIVCGAQAQDRITFSYTNEIDQALCQEFALSAPWMTSLVCPPGPISGTVTVDADDVAAGRVEFGFDGSGPHSPGVGFQLDAIGWTFTEANSCYSIRLGFTEDGEVSGWALELSAPCPFEPGVLNADLFLSSGNGATNRAAVFLGGSVELQRLGIASGRGRWSRGAPGNEPGSPALSGNQLGDPCARPGSCAAGNPIDIASGNKFQQVSDYTTVGPNVLGFARYYNSHASLGAATLATSLGANWRGTFDRYIRITSPASVSVERADGRMLDFALTGSGWTAETDVDLRLVQSGPTTWTLTDASDTVETYAGVGATQAILTQIRARNGYTQTLFYDAANDLTAVTDSFGRSLTFTYAGPLLQTLTTPDGLVLTYGYGVSGVDPGVLDRLTSVSYSTVPVTSQEYLYEDAAHPFALTGIFDENGSRYARWNYDAQGRGISSEHGGGAERTTIAYNADGSRAVTNALGQQTTYHLTTLQGVPKLTRMDRLASPSTAAATRTFTYDANGYLASQTDWNGTRTTYVNDDRGLPLSITEAQGTLEARTTTFTYDATRRVPTRIVQPGVTTDLTYDADGNLLTRTETDTTTHALPYPTNGTRRTWTYRWSGALLQSVRGPRTDVASVTRFTYNASGALAAVTNTLGHRTEVTQHTPGGLPLTVVDANGVRTELAYDTRLRLVTSTLYTAAGPLTTSYNYDSAGNRGTTTLPDGSALTSAHDSAHRLTGLTDLFGQQLAYVLDALGGRTQVEATDAAGVVTRTGTARFDALGRVVEETGGAGQTRRYAYDDNDNALVFSDPLGRPTQQLFDAFNRLVRVIDPAGGVTSTRYDALDRPLSVTAPNGAVTTYVYDGFGRRIQTLSPDSGKTVYRYDLAGNLTRKTDARNLVATYTYDALDRLGAVRYPGAPAENVAYRYDEAGHGSGVGRLTSLTDAVGLLSRVYDERGNVTAETRTRGSVTLATAYGHDAASRTVSVTYPSGGRAVYVRDVMGRVTDITFAPNRAAALPVASGIDYLPFGPESGLTFGNGIIETRRFDQDYRLTGLTGAGLAPVQDLTYAYDAADNVLSIADGVDAPSTQGFGYDTLDRLIAATGAYGVLGYTYDSVGNRLTQRIGAALTTYTYTARSNRLTQVRAGAALQVLSYTPSGNITSIANVPNPRPATGIAYNQAGQLARVLSGGVQTQQNTYDAFGQRLVRQGRATGTTLFQYDVDGRLLEDADGLGRPRVDYVYLGDRPIATFQVGFNKLTFLHNDRLGTPQLATDAAQAVVWKAGVEPFGAANVSVSLASQNLRLPGQEFEADTGWHHNGFRDYVPALGRYLQSDPIGLAGGTNAYRYAADNPLSYLDRRGLDIEILAQGTRSIALEVLGEGEQVDFFVETHPWSPFWKKLWDMCSIVGDARRGGVKGVVGGIARDRAAEEGYNYLIGEKVRIPGGDSAKLHGLLREMFNPQKGVSPGWVPLTRSEVERFLRAAREKKIIDNYSDDYFRRVLDEAETKKGNFSRVAYGGW